MPSQIPTVFALALLLAIFPSASPAKDGVVQCGNLIYAGTATSYCFSDAFLSHMQQCTTIPAERRFKSVKLASEELFGFPFVVMTGQTTFSLSRTEREHLDRYLHNGGFLLASAGCSNKDWARSFRLEMTKMFGAGKLAKIGPDHPIFRTVHTIENLKLSKGSGYATLEGVQISGKIVVVFSEEGLNDSHKVTGCCCCGGNEVQNSMEVNANILAYALLY